MKNLRFGILLILTLSCQGPEVSDTPSVEATDTIGMISRGTELSDTTTYLERRAPSTPAPPPDYDTTQWTDLADREAGILIDMRYATDSNFVEEKMYPCSRCFLRPAVARAVIAAHRELAGRNMGLKMLDCYRPLPIQWKLWEKVPDRRYVSDPRKGSMHNRGAAVDLTIVDSQGRELNMGTPYDFFGREAYHTFTSLSDSILENRRLLKNLMERHQFRSIRTEWWHYSFTGASYELSDMVWNCPGD